MKRKLQAAFIFLVVIFSLRFFDAHFISEEIINYGSYLLFLMVLGLSVPHMLSERGGLILPVQLVFAGILLSMPMAYLAWGQGIKDTIIITLPYLMWVLFFFLLRVSFPVKLLEKIVLTYGVIYIVLYFFQLSQSPTVLFGSSMWGDEFIESRGIVRIIFPGAGIFILAVFIAVNKLTTQRKDRMFWVFMVAMGVLIPVLQVTRQFVIGISMIFLYHFLKGQNFFKKSGTVVAFIIVVLFVFNTDTKVITGLIEAAQRDIELGSDYIRVKAAEYFLTDFSPNLLTRLLGNGAPMWGLSAYGIYVARLAGYEGLYQSDVGIIGMYSMFGILPVIGYIIIWVKSFTVELPEEYQYVRYYFWYLLLTSFTWYTVYHYHYIMSTVFALYIFHVISQRVVEFEREDGSRVKLFFSQEAEVESR